jgi:hypothetical protein
LEYQELDARGRARIQAEGPVLDLEPRDVFVSEDRDAAEFGGNAFLRVEEAVNAAARGRAEDLEDDDSIPTTGQLPLVRSK